MGFFRSYQSLLDRWASGRTVVITLIAAMTVYGYMVFVSIPAVMAYEGSLRLLDMKPLGYDLEYVRLLFHGLGSEGRAVYLTRQLPIDMVYPALFAISGCLLLAYLIRKGLPYRGGLMWLTLIPILAGMCDYAENLTIISMLRSFPDLSPGLARFSSIMTVAKSSLTTVFWLSMLAILITVLTRKRDTAPAE